RRLAKRKRRRRQPPAPGRPRTAPPIEPSRRADSRWTSRRVALVAAIAVVAVAAVVAIVLTRSSNGTATRSSPSSTVATSAPVSTTAAPQGPVPARRLFAVYCGICHTLADAGVTGDVGPNLDRLAPTRARVLAAIR